MVAEPRRESCQTRSSTSRRRRARSARPTAESDAQRSTNVSTTATASARAAASPSPQRTCLNASIKSRIVMGGIDSAVTFEMSVRPHRPWRTGPIAASLHTADTSAPEKPAQRQRAWRQHGRRRGRHAAHTPTCRRRHDVLDILVRDGVRVGLQQRQHELLACRTVGQRNVQPLHKPSPRRLVQLLWSVRCTCIAQYRETPNAARRCSEVAQCAACVPTTRTRSEAFVPAPSNCTRNSVLMRRLDSMSFSLQHTHGAHPRCETPPFFVQSQGSRADIPSRLTQQKGPYTAT
jgi:hypothetical protein